MRTTFLAALALGLAGTTVSRAQLDGTLPTLETFRPTATQPVVVSALDVDLRVDGPTMRVTQRITLTNPNPSAQEFDLIFPLGSGSVITGLDLRNGNEVLEGRVYSADEARAVYQEIVRRTQDPALLEHYGEAMLRARVFPVPASGEATVTLSYTRIVEPEGGLSRLHVPLTSFRRSTTGLAFTCRGEILARHPVTTLYSPTHALMVAKIEEIPTEPPVYRSAFEITEEASRCELDLIVYTKASSGNGLLDVAILSERPDPDEPGYFLAVVDGVPNDDVAPEPKDVVFVIDRSGSMDGAKMEQAVAALRFLVERLRPEDRFDIVSYSASADSLFGELRDSTPANIAEARLYLDRVAAEGGTNIHEALSEALAKFGESERVPQVVFLTDGLPTVGEQDTHQLAKLVTEANAHGARLVAFGVGYDVNGILLDKLAVQNRGMSEYVLPDENIEDKVPGFYARMQSPLLLDTRLSFGDARVFDLFPRVVGDIYGGHQLVLTGRYHEPGDAVLTVSGRRGGQQVALEFPCRFQDGSASGGGDLVARIWAAKKVGFLVDEIRLNGPNDELVQAIVKLGTRFGILTEYTSFLAAPQTDLAAAADNLRLADEVLGELADLESGVRGVGQAVNSKLRQRAATAETRNVYYDEHGRLALIDSVQTVGGKTFFLRPDGWLDSTATAAEGAEDAQLVQFASDEFFLMLDRSPELAAFVARTGANASLDWEEKLIRFVNTP